MHSRIRADYHPICAIPSFALDPVCGTEECVRSTVARVKRVKTFDAVMIVRFKERHEERLGGLATINRALRADFEASDLFKLKLGLSN